MKSAERKEGIRLVMYGPRSRLHGDQHRKTSVGKERGARSFVETFIPQQWLLFYCTGAAHVLDTDSSGRRPDEGSPSLSRFEHACDQ